MLRRLVQYLFAIPFVLLGYIRDPFVEGGGDSHEPDDY